MDRARNPYVPGAGRRPAALVGRDDQLSSWDVAIDRTVSGRGAQPVALYGLRGVGKTVLLSAFQQSTEARSWIVAKIEAGTKPLREALADELHAPLTDLARPTAGTRLRRALKTALSFRATYETSGSWSFGLDLSETTGGGADTGSIESDLGRLVRDLSAAAAEESIGLAILIDEAQDLSRDEMRALCSVAHVVGQQSWPVLLGLAGLPSLPRMLAEARSYAERLFDYHRIEHLPPAEAVRAITDPARQEGVTWTADAVDYVVQQAGGYPYYLQQFGQECWAQATMDPIDMNAARLGVVTGTAALDSGFFRARWDRATRAEQQYLRAMAVDGDEGSASGAVASRLNRKLASLSPARNNLINKGLIFAPEHGIVQFTVPGMAEFIRRQPEP